MLSNRESHAAKYPPQIKIISDAVFKAAKGLRRDFGEVEHLQVSAKGAFDFVTSAHLKAEKILVEELSKLHPDYGFLCEERGEVKGASEYRYIIDPLDGTANYMHGIPYFCTSVGLEKTNEDGSKEIVAGVIYDPILDELYWAEKGSGAFCNNRKLRVSGRKELAKAMIASPSPSGRMASSEYFEGLKKIASQSFGIRCSGSAAMDLAYVAAGKFDAFYRGNIKPWDVAAGIIIIKEAGGVVTEINGGDNIIYGENLLASNEAVHKSIDKVLS